MSEDKRYFEVIDNKFWILTDGDKGLIAFQTFEKAIRAIFAHSLEEFVIEGRGLAEFRNEPSDNYKFKVVTVKLIDMVKEWYRITGREKAEEKEYVQRPAGYERDNEETTKLRQDQEVN